MSKKIGYLAIFLVLLIGLLSMNIVLSQENTDDSSDTSDSVSDASGDSSSDSAESSAAEESEEGVEDEIGSGEVEIIEEDEVSQEIEDAEEASEITKTTEEEKKAIFRLTKVTTGRGFVMKDDESDAQFFRGTWIVRRIIEKPLIPEDLAEIKGNAIKSKRFGFIVIGTGKEKEKFGIRIKNFSEDKVLFDLIDKNGNLAGSMEITPKRYEKITLWFGNINLDSGNYAGKWLVTAVSKTIILKPRIERPPIWNIFAFKQRREAALKEKLQEKLFEREGLGAFVKAHKKELRDLKNLSKEKRKIQIERRMKRIREAEDIREEALRIKQRAMRELEEDLEVKERVVSSIKERVKQS